MTRTRITAAAIVATLAIGFLTVACGSEKNGSDSQCPYYLEYRGITYTGAKGDVAVPSGPDLGTARTATCDDGNGGQSDPPTDVGVRQIGTIDPDIALFGNYLGPKIWIAQGIREDTMPPELRALLLKQNSQPSE